MWTLEVTKFTDINNVIGGSDNLFTNGNITYYGNNINV